MATLLHPRFIKDKYVFSDYDGIRSFVAKELTELKDYIDVSDNAAICESLELSDDHLSMIWYQDYSNMSRNDKKYSVVLMKRVPLSRDQLRMHVSIDDERHDRSFFIEDIDPQDEFSEVRFDRSVLELFEDAPLLISFREYTWDDDTQKTVDSAVEHVYTIDELPAHLPV